MPANLNNNSFATPTNITTTAGSSPLTGSLSATGGDEVDYYRFSLSSDSNLKIVLNGLTGDARLSLYRRTDSAVATENDLVQNLPTNNQGRLSDVIVLNDAAAGAGTYYLKVDLGSAAPSADYKLSVVTSSSDFSGSILWRNSAANVFAPWRIQDTTVVGTSSQPISSDYVLVGTGDFDGDGTNDFFWQNRNINSSDYGAAAIWWTNDGMTFAPGSAAIRDSLGNVIRVGQEWNVQSLKDLDGNGTADILWRNLVSGDIAMWLMGKNPQTGVPTISGGTILNRALGFTLPASSGWDVVGVNNIDSQFGADVLWKNRFSNQVALWTLSSTAILSATVVPIQPSLDYKIIGFVDVTGDGQADIIWRNDQRNQLAIWKMNGTTLVDSVAYSVSSAYKVAAIKDLNGDGIADFLWRNTDNGQGGTYGWLMGGGTNGLAYTAARQLSLTNGSNPFVGSGYEVLGVHDFDGFNNSTSHILWRGQAGDVYVWKMDGLTIVESKLLSNATGSAWQLPSLNYGDYKEPQFGSVQLTSQFQTIGGSSSTEAFDIGVLNNKGVYKDTVSNRNNKTDWYKFTVLQSTDFKASDENSSVSLELYKADANGNLTTTAVPYPTEGNAIILDTGTYYLKVNAGGSSNGLLPYTLNVEGVPRTIDVFGTNFRLAETTATNPPTGSNDFSTDLPDVTNTGNPERKTVKSFLTIKNGGTVKTGSFKVKYYLSRTSTIDPDSSTTVLLKTVDVTNGVDPAVVGSQDPTTGTFTLIEDLVLPDGRNIDPKKFWTRDAGTYYIGVVIDADNNLVEGAEGEQNNTNQGNFLDSSSFVANNVQVAELVGQSLTVINPSQTYLPEGTLQVSYSVQNQGRRPTTDFNNKINIQFVLSQDNIIGNADDSTLVSDLVEIAGIAGSTASGPATSGVQTRNIFLPDSLDNFWQNLGTGTKTVYIGMRIDPGNLIEESVEDNNLNQGLGIDFASFQVDLQPIT
ncbi:pre-peptidase C-terminal domain-containing protein [Alkalinema sp. FACHB-956]|uniref:pre-peptidase C-terminal domain-containing protein n=1 Tax=Alkalinema sp. FACHB-956 TaxID=2692768 RepID=UPI0016830D4B|nr:pre-peptidase C-terminal domain-containing protein [Alkalinema sp. FACHB-956]MBD2327732.1 VCBS repeat-containing protein [Alkalinema sp. FACHB-956]